MLFSLLVLYIIVRLIIEHPREWLASLADYTFLRNHRIESFIFFPILYNVPHDFENNGKTMLMETNQSLFSWKVSQPTPYTQKKSAWSCRVLPGTPRSHYSSWKRVFDFNKRNKLICDSTGRSEILNSTRCSDYGKMHSAVTRAISLPFSSQFVKFIPNFTPSGAITYSYIIACV